MCAGFWEYVWQILAHVDKVLDSRPNDQQYHIMGIPTQSRLEACSCATSIPLLPPHCLFHQEFCEGCIGL